MVKKVLVGLLIAAVCTSFAAVFGYWYTLDSSTYLTALGRSYLMWTKPISKDTSYDANLNITVDALGGITIWLISENSNLKVFDGATVSISVYSGKNKYTMYTVKNVPFEPSGTFIATSNPTFVSSARYLISDAIVLLISSFRNSDKIEVKVTTPKKTYTYYYSPIGLHESVQYLYILSSYGL